MEERVSFTGDKNLAVNASTDDEWLNERKRYWAQWGVEAAYSGAELKQPKPPEDVLSAMLLNIGHTKEAIAEMRARSSFLGPTQWEFMLDALAKAMLA